MDLLILIVLLFLAVALAVGYLSAQHAIIKPVADWMYPPTPETPLADDGTHAASREAKQQEGKVRRETQRRREDARREKEQRRLETTMARQHAAEAAREERERRAFWRAIERIERKSDHYDLAWWNAFHREYGTSSESRDSAANQTHQSPGPRKSDSGRPPVASRKASR